MEEIKLKIFILPYVMFKSFKLADFANKLFDNQSRFIIHLSFGKKELRKALM